MKNLRVMGTARERRVRVSKKYTDSRIPIRLFIVLGVAVSFMSIVPLMEHPYVKLVTAVWVLGGVLFVLSAIFAMRTPTAGRMKLSTNELLRFPCPQLPRVGYFLGNVCFLSYGILMITALPLARMEMVDSAREHVAAYGLLLIGLFGVGYSIRCGITPFGIELSPQGVRWQYWGNKSFISWEDIGQVELGMRKSARSILLVDRKTGVTQHIDISTMGSDPVIIAEAIAYFLRYPKERETLNDPVAALSLVMDLSEPSESRA